MEQVDREADPAGDAEQRLPAVQEDAVDGDPQNAPAFAFEVLAARQVSSELPLIRAVAVALVHEHDALTAVDDVALPEEASVPCEQRDVDLGFRQPGLHDHHAEDGLHRGPNPWPDQPEALFQSLDGRAPDRPHRGVQLVEYEARIVNAASYEVVAHGHDVRQTQQWTDHAPRLERAGHGIPGVLVEQPGSRRVREDLARAQPREGGGGPLGEGGRHADGANPGVQRDEVAPAQPGPPDAVRRRVGDGEGGCAGQRRGQGRGVSHPQIVGAATVCRSRLRRFAPGEDPTIRPLTRIGRSAAVRATESGQRRGREGAGRIDG